MVVVTLYTICEEFDKTTHYSWDEDVMTINKVLDVEGNFLSQSSDRNFEEEKSVF